MLNVINAVIVGLLITIGVSSLNGQVSTGKITFKETRKLDMEVPEGMEEMADLFPDNVETIEELIYNEKTSVYATKEVPEDNELEHESGNMSFKVKTVSSGGKNILFKDLEKGEILNQQNFFGRDFLIKGSLSEMKWKIVNEQKEILGRLCQKAELVDTTNTFAWFALDIPVSNGPGRYGQLPGMILEVSSDDGKHIITAEEISFELGEEDGIERPKKGKKVSQEKFDKIVEERMEEMTKGRGGNQTVIRIGG